MSLTSRVTALAQAIGADVKSLITGLAGKVSKSGDTLSGPLNPAPMVTLAAAATLDIGASTSEIIMVTDGDPITSLGAGPVGSIRHLMFGGVISFVQDAAHLVLPEGVDMSSNAGGSATFYCTAASKWVCIGWNYGPCAITHGPAYQQLQDFVNPALSRLTIYGGAQAYSQDAALIYGSGSLLTRLQARTPTTPRTIYLPDASGDVFLIASGAEAPIPPLAMPPIVGRYYAGSWSGFTAAAVVSGDAYFNTVFIRQSMPMQKIGFTVTTAGAAGSTAQICLYRINNGAFTAVTSPTIVATDTVGDKYVTPIGNIAAGTYMIAVKFTGVCSINFQNNSGPSGNGSYITLLHGAANSTDLATASSQLFYTVTNLPLGPISMTVLSYRSGPNPHFWFQA